METYFAFTMQGDTTAGRVGGEAYASMIVNVVDVQNAGIRAIWLPSRHVFRRNLLLLHMAAPPGFPKLIRCVRRATALQKSVGKVGKTAALLQASHHLKLHLWRGTRVETYFAFTM